MVGSAWAAARARADLGADGRKAAVVLLNTTPARSAMFLVRTNRVPGYCWWSRDALERVEMLRLRGFAALSGLAALAAV